MSATINMQDMRYLNLFGRISQVSTRHCVKYNETLIFCVPKSMISKAVGEKGKNIKKMNEILGKKIKVIASPDGEKDIKEFLRNIISPNEFKDLEVRDNEIIVTAGANNKAALLGRNKRRLLELQKVAEDYFKKSLRIV